jgi:glycosyltransferase involved in cell wall biosynthesis
MNEASEPSTIRVSIQQPCLAKYRVPVFRELAHRSGLQVRVHYAANWNVPSVDPDGFDASVAPVRPLAGRRLFWHQPQWNCASPEQSDVVVLTWNIRFLTLVPALIRARLSGVGTVLWGHGYSKQERGWRRALRNRIAASADSILLYNHTAAQQLVNDGFPAERIHVALNSLDQRPIRRARKDWLNRPDDLAAFREQHGLGAGPVILFVSRLEEENRVDLLLEAAARLLPGAPALKIVIVGDGPDGARLREQCERLGLAEAVIFAGKIYNEQALAPWFLSADVFCYPANVGLSLLHAFGYGVPVVTSDKLESQNPEIEALDDGVNGLFYRDGDVASLTAALERITSDSDLRHRLASEALRTVTTRFTIENMVDGIEASVRQAAAAAAQRRNGAVPPTASRSM